MLLAIDTATRTYGAALHDGERLVAEQLWLGSGPATAAFAPEIALLLRRVGASPGDVSGLGVAQGPGSFTGLRIGLALAKGMALARSLPVIGVPTHRILAEGQRPRAEPMLALVEAGRGRAAGQRFTWSGAGWQTTGPVEVKSYDAWWESLSEPTYVCGELDREVRAKAKGKRNALLASGAWCARRPAVLAELAWDALRQTGAGDAGALAPIYLDAALGPTP